MRTSRTTKTLIASVANAICLSQTPAGAGALTINGHTNGLCASQTPASGTGALILNGVLAPVGGFALLGTTPRTVTITSGGNFSAATLQINGTGPGGLAQSETLAGPNANTVTSAKQYTAISSITFTASPGAIAVTAGINGAATLDTQRVVGVTSGGGNESGRTFTITGTDDNGTAISESIAGPGIGATVSTAQNFKTVTGVSVDAATAGAITVGTTGVGASVAIPIDQYIDPTNAGLTVEVSGTVNYDVQYTLDDIYSMPLANLNWVSGIAAMAGKTANTDTELTETVSAVRLKLNSNTPPGNATLIVKQAGGFGRA